MLNKQINMIKPDLNRIKNRLSKIQCNECGKYPDVSIIGNEIDINCCLCDGFKDKLVETAKNIYGKQANEYVASEINRSLGKFL